jgi:DNA-binding XRE family transcriptional regulator
MTPDDLRTLRAAAGLTQAALAKVVGCHRYTVIRWEMGQMPIAEETEPYLIGLLQTQIERRNAQREKISRMLQEAIASTLPSLRRHL